MVFRLTWLRPWYRLCTLGTLVAWWLIVCSCGGPRPIWMPVPCRENGAIEGSNFFVDFTVNGATSYFFIVR
jgi:hypothetical protein